MSKNTKEPSEKIKLTLYFDTEQGKANFVAWYLDGGGEQDSHYYSERRSKDWIYLQPPANACPKCEYSHDEDRINGFFFGNRSVKAKKFACGNCGNKYLIKNTY